MKRNILFILASLFSLCTTTAQGWSETIDAFSGLPGEKRYTDFGEVYYFFKSENYTPGGTLDIIRLTITETPSNQRPSGNNIIFSLSELNVYDGDGNSIEYEAVSNADHNSLAGSEDGDGLPALSDNDITTYFHSMWQQPAVTEHHYIELKLEKAVTTFSLEWTTRLNYPNDAPKTVGLTLGTVYNPENASSNFALGDAVTSEEELVSEKQFFVLKSNATTYFTTSTGTTYSGQGPIFMQCAETGDKTASMSHIMQLIPTGDGEYLVYWPVSKKFLKESNEDSNEYNGTNGWQRSTTEIDKAARVKITPDGKGFFGMEYNTTYQEKPITLYIGGELRDGVVSKMKTFDLEHKQYLEDGDYSKGFSLPIAFNWSIYKADVTDEAANRYYLNIAEECLSAITRDAESYLTQYGDFNGKCPNGEDITLRQKIDEGNSLINSSSLEFNDIVAKRDEISSALSAYLAVKLYVYEDEINVLLQDSEFSSYPDYKAGTYPESSKEILDNTLKSIANAKANAGTYSPEQFESIYSQIEGDIEIFNATKITETTGGDGTGEDNDTIEKELICIYLSNGDVDIYEKSDIDGNYYTEGDKLYIPLKDDETMYYTSEEYDSCSTVMPPLPTMVSYKFNNKYNPNLNTDIIAEPVTESINLSVNSIGKWLTASFTLSDDKAVAYVDTVLQESKATRQSFANSVTYHVTYPGYNIVKRVKVQDEIWSGPSTGEPEIIPLTASMMSTNKPPRTGEGTENLFDNDPNTMFHTTWGGTYEPTVIPYLQFDLTESVEVIQIYYMTRSYAVRSPESFEIHVSKDGYIWNNVRTFTAEADGLPTSYTNEEYRTPDIDLGGSYTKIRFVQTACSNYSKNHLALAELRLYKVGKATTDSIKLQDAVYENKRIPYGKEYKVNINWLTDNPKLVPRIDIDIENGKFVTSKDYYLKANFRITGYGVYENFEDSVEIKGRGNTSWGYSKKPYRLKFAEKVKPFGLTKGKSWVLLANAQNGSLMANAVSMKIGQMAKAEYTNHIIPVDLYMNGMYMGNYMFTEKVGMANNSVDVDEELGYLLELDTYYDENYKFKTSTYNLPVNVKEPDFLEYDNETIQTRFTKIQNDMNALCDALGAGDEIDAMLDMDALARFMLANDLSLNQEINHPKSTFLFKENQNDSNAKLKFGPIWDFDWGYGYEGSSSYCTTNATGSILKSNFEGYSFIRDLTMKESFKKQYYKVWKEFISNNSLDELIDFIDSYYTFAEESFQRNATEWGYRCGFSTEDRDRMKEWITERKNHIYSNLEEYDINDLIYAITGDVNCNNQVTVHDAALITAHLNGNTYAGMSSTKADCDGNGKIELADAKQVAEIVKTGDAPSSNYWYSTPLAAGDLYSNSFALEMGNVETAQINLLSYNEEQYKAMQFDIELPAGVTLIDLSNEQTLAGHDFSYIDKGNNLYRVVAYSNEDKEFTTGDNALVSLLVLATDIISEENRTIRVKNAFVVDSNNNELRLNDYSILFSQTTGIEHTGSTMLIEGGDCISITLLEAEEISIYSVDGRKVREIKAKEGTIRISVPAGIYIVNGKKVTVRR